jgi:hypothetical protein
MLQEKKYPNIGIGINSASASMPIFHGKFSGALVSLGIELVLQNTMGKIIITTNAARKKNTPALASIPMFHKKTSRALVSLNIELILQNSIIITTDAARKKMPKHRHRHRPRHQYRRFAKSYICIYHTCLLRWLI